MTLIRKSMIATALLAAATAAAVDSGRPAQANEYAWCAIMSGQMDGGGSSCGFENLEQCRAALSGIGGGCAPNPRYVAAPLAAQRNAAVRNANPSESPQPQKAAPKR